MARKISVAKTKTSPTEEVVYTIPSKNVGLWNMLYVISTATNETPAVWWLDKSAQDAGASVYKYKVLGSKNLGAGEYVLLNQAEVVLQEGDQISIQQAGSNSVTYIFTIELVPSLATQFHGG
jgi:hypothetical protein